jgi:hypothetical protein
VRNVETTLVVVCDGCKRFATFQALDIAGAVARARAYGWGVRPASDHCAACEVRRVRKETTR